MSAPEPRRLSAKDGVALAGAHFAASGVPRGRIVVAGATGVPQTFYAPFARFAADGGFETLTFDYRGIARSKRASLAGFEASFVDWARLDLAGVIDAMPDDGVPLFLVAHSFGGHALGLMPNHARLRAAVICACGAGWSGWIPPLERLRVWALWHVLFPPLVRLRGFMPMSMFGMGEDLPLGVYRQWKYWCTFPHYFLDDPEAAELTAACATVRTPMLAFTALDDAWAPPRSRDAFLLRAYPHSAIERVDLDPRGFGGAIGHVGYFRRHMTPLWSRALEWLAAPVEP